MTWSARIDDINWIEHIIDFGVIFAADVLAAYIAVNWFESHRTEEERRQASFSLNRLYQICSQLQERYAKMLAGFEKSDDSAGTVVPKEITEIDRNFISLDKDYLFWTFPRGAEFRQQYNVIKEQKEALSPRTVAQAKEQLHTLIEALNKIINEAGEMLRPPPSHLQKLKSWFWRKTT